MRDKELARGCHGTVLDVLNPQTKYSSALLELFKWVLQDQAYVERLKRHYALFKSDLRGKRKLATRSGRQARRMQ
jgi:hypothetical protein